MRHKRNPQGNTQAWMVVNGEDRKVNVESINSLKGTALVRLPGQGFKVRKVLLRSLDFGYSYPTIPYIRKAAV